MIDALVGQQSQGGQVDGGLRQPHPARAPPEADLEVAQAPADLGPPVGGGGQRQDGVVERLGQAVGPAIAVDEAAVGDRVALVGAEPAGQGRPEVPGHRPEVAELGVGPVAVGGDPRVPVAGGGRRRIDRGPPGDRVLAGRLIEVPVDDEGRRGHAGVASARRSGATDAAAADGSAVSSRARSRVVVTVWRRIRDQRSPMASRSGHDTSRPLPW